MSYFGSCTGTHCCVSRAGVSPGTGRGRGGTDGTDGTTTGTEGTLRVVIEVRVGEITVPGPLFMPVQGGGLRRVSSVAWSVKVGTIEVA